MTTRSPFRYSRREFAQLALAGVPASLLLRQRPETLGVRIGVQSYSFRTMPLDAALKAMADIGIPECELWSGHVEPRPARRPDGAPRGPNPGMREAQRKWRLETSLDHFTAIREQFEAAGVKIQAYNLSFNRGFTDEEIDRGFEMAKALGAGFITASATLDAAERVAPFAEKHQMVVAMHNHSNLEDPNEFATPESFAKAMAMSKLFRVNLDIGHFTAANFDPVAYIGEHHANITNLHLKDRKKDQGANVVWGEGDTPITAVLQLLKQKGYDIPANIEYEYKGSNPVAEVRKCFEYCREALT